MQARRWFGWTLVLFLTVAMLTFGACGGDPNEGETPDVTDGTDPGAGEGDGTASGGSADTTACTGQLFPVPPTLAGTLPEDIPFLDQAAQQNPNLTPEEARPYFDNFSWQTFVALAWPSNVATDRGQPLDPTDLGTFENPPAGSVPTWFGYRTADDLFGEADPPAWSSSSTDGGNPCDTDTAKGFLMLTKSGAGTVLDNLNEAFSYPLIDQNQNYAYYDIQFNQAQYDFIRTNQYYLIKNLAAAQPITMPASSTTGTPPDSDGSIMIKTAWRQMVDTDQTDRYFTIDAQLFVPDEEGSETTGDVTYGNTTGTCVPATMGLVGIHIVRKIDGFPQWIWSTFEQVDNIEAPAGVPISFNNGTDTPKTEGGWANRPPSMSPDLQPKDERVPVQVTRYNPIPSTPANCPTPGVTDIYQQALAATGTPWQHYQLIATQWPSDPTTFVLPARGGVYPQDCGGAFPANGIVNVSAETYVQSPGDAAGAGGNSCMSCHYGAAESDFSWVLQDRAR